MLPRNKTFSSWRRVSYQPKPNLQSLGKDQHDLNRHLYEPTVRHCCSNLRDKDSKVALLPSRYGHSTI
ncbi:hypothetical protein Ae201684_010237 [Aphanomyces euteiches]|uniref:Uncharacterized protein n=1 Tax=Aphanomyces euteiches TaxID=100861 RepID=A0A6G0WYR9_9STRA|nr:hypothetical protein Ae201684_010237 [Aphanomyces euteiches]